MKKYLLIFMGVFTLFLSINIVNAESFGESFVNFVVNAIKTVTGDGSIVSNVKNTKDYDSRLSLFDSHENSIPLCDANVTVYDNGVLREDTATHTVCKKGTVPSITTLIEYLPYLIRYEYKIKNTDTIYYVWIFYNEKPYIDSYNVVNNNQASYFIISQLPEYITTVDGSIIPLNATYKSMSYRSYGVVSVYNSNTILGNFEFNNSYWNTMLNFYFDYSDNPYFDISVSSNFDLVRKSDNSIVVDSSTGTSYNFNTDVDITISPDEYLDLIPKISSDFTTNIYTNNFFSFDYAIYDKYEKTYSTIKSGALNEVNFSALGGFNWFNWNIQFSGLDLSLNPIISIFNPNDTELKVKIHSQYFDYRIVNKNTGEYCVNGICYSNRYDDMYNLGHSFNYISDFNSDSYNDGLNFIKDIPNMIKSFVSSFAFIGTLFTTVFTIFTGDLLNYFYVLFGIMIIMLIIRVLK